MTLVLRLILLLSVTLMPLRALADVSYRFDITTAYATSNPFPNRLDTAFTADDTGYLQIANIGTADYRGIIRLVAHPGVPGVDDMSFDLPNGFIPAGGVVSIAVPNDASDVGGFNAPLGSFQPGIILYLEGTVIHDGASAGIKIAVQDLDIHSGVIRTDSYGYQTDSFVLQGGDPFGFDNGDAFELSQNFGHYTVTGLVSEPRIAAILLLAMTVLSLVHRETPRLRHKAYRTRGGSGG